MAIVFKNNAKTTLAGNVTTSATSITVSDGSVFPAISGGDTFFCTFDDGTNNEIVSVTAISGNVLTVVRAQDNTTAKAFTSGDAAESRLTAGILDIFSQVDSGEVTADEFIGDLRGAVIFKASAGEAVSKGDAVYVSGISGNTPVVSLADADDANKMPAFGLVLTAASTNGSTEVVTFGTILGIDTSAFSVGDTLYISTTTGELTNSKPTGEGSLIQNIGKVQRSHASAGSIKVGGAGRTNDTPNLNDGNIFIGNASNQATTASLNTKIEDYLDANGTTFPDNVKAQFGTGSDLQIYHNGSASYIDDQGTGPLYLRGNTVTALNLLDVAMFTAIGGNKVGLNFNGNEKLATTSTGINVTGVITTDGLTTSADINFGDNDKAIFGAGSDLQIYHSGTNSIISEQGTGVLEVRTNGTEIQLTGNSGTDYMARFVSNGKTQLHYDGSAKLDTTSTGIDVTGTVTATGGNSTNWNTAYGWGNHASQSYATQSYVGTQISNLVDSSPAALNTLNELAAALGDDANFSTTVTNSIATKLPLAGGTMTGTLAMGANAITSTGTISSGAITSSDNITTDGTNAYILANRSATNRRSALVFTTNASDVNAQPPATATIDYALGVTDSDEVSGNKFFIKAGDTNSSGSQFFLDSSGATFAGTISSGTITSTGDVRADTHFNSTDTNATLSATGSGNVYLRPNGKSSTSGQVHIATSGNATFAGTISSGAITSTGSSSLGSVSVAGNLVVDDTLTIGDNTANSNSFIKFKERIAATETNNPFIGQTNSGNGVSQDLGLGANSTSGTVKIYAGNVTAFSESAVRLKVASDHINFTEPLQMGGTEFLSDSRNLTNIGTISSGAITSSGLLTLNDNYAMINAGTTSNTTLEPVIWARSQVGASVVQMNVQGDEWQFGGGGTLDTTPILKLKYGTNAATFAGAISSGTITASDTSGSYGTAINLTAGDNLSAGQGAKQIVMAFGSSSTVDYPHSIRTRHNSNAATGNNIEFWLWNQGTDSSSTIGTKRALVLENSTGLDLLTGGYKVGGTTVIDASRNMFANDYYYLDSKVMAQGTDGYLRINQSNQFSAGVWFGSSNIYSATGKYIATGSNGGTTSSRVYMYGGTYNGTNVIALDGTDGKIKGSYYAVGGTTVIDASRNLTNIGTISSGTISSTGNLDVDGIIDNTRNNGNVSAPNTSDHTAGTRINFYDSNATSWYAMGIENSTLWFNTDSKYKWYEDANLRMTLDGANLTVSGTISSGAITATGAINSTGTGRAIQVNGTTRINSVGDIIATSYYIGSTNIIDTSRNLTNIGTISSGAITSTGLTVSTSTGAVINLTDSGSHTWKLTTDNQDNFFRVKDGTSATYLKVGTADSEFATNLNLTSGHGFKINGTEVITSGRNLTNIGTISSGAITSSGVLTLSSVASDTINFSGTTSSDYRGISFNGRAAITADSTDGWLRFNNASEFTNGMFSPGGAWINGFLRSSQFQISTTTVIDSSRNLVNIGTISSGAITSSGKVIATQLDLVGADVYIAYGSAGTAPSNGDYLRLRDVATGNDALQFYMDSVKLFSIDGQTGNAYHKGTITATGDITAASGTLTVQKAGSGGGQIGLGDWSNGNPIGISEGLWNTVTTDNDYLTVYTRSSFNIRGYGGGTTHWLSLTNSNLNLVQGQSLSLAGTTVIDASRNLVNIAGITSTGAFSNTSSTRARFGAGTGNNQGLDIKFGSGGSDYAAQRFYSGSSNTHTIHVFSNAWQSGNFESGSAGAINIEGLLGVTFGAWNSVDGYIRRTTGNTYFKGNLQIGDYSGSHQIEIASGQNTAGYLRFNDVNNTEGSYVRSTGASGSTGGDLVFGSRWNTDTDRIYMEMTGTTVDTPNAMFKMASSSFMFGGNNSGKESNSAQISAGQHQSNSLNFVGMASGTTSADRRMDFWVEGGAYFRGNLVATGNVTAYGSTSDKRLKKDIVKIDNAIDKIKSVSGYEFAWNENAPEDKQDKREFGVIAQEVEEAGLEKLVFEYERPVSGTDEDNKELPDEKWKAVHYDKFVPILIEAIKDQQKEIEYMKSEIKHLQENDNGDN